VPDDIPSSAQTNPGASDSVLEALLASADGTQVNGSCIACVAWSTNLQNLDTNPSMLSLYACARIPYAVRVRTAADE